MTQGVGTNNAFVDADPRKQGTNDTCKLLPEGVIILLCDLSWHLLRKVRMVPENRSLILVQSFGLHLRQGALHPVHKLRGCLEYPAGQGIGFDIVFARGKLVMLICPVLRELAALPKNDQLLRGGSILTHSLEGVVAENGAPNIHGKMAMAMFNSARNK